MPLGITQFGIVQRHNEGQATICRPGRSGGPGTEIEVDADLADAHNLATGDIAEGLLESVEYLQSPTAASDECLEDAYPVEEEVDEPGALRGVSVPAWIATRPVPTERLASITRVNGLAIAEADERPSPRQRRHASERSAPNRRLRLAVGPSDLTGRMLDAVAPLGFGDAGMIYGPHGSGLTRTLRQVVAGACQNHAENAAENPADALVVIVLLLRARGEEITDWRRRFPNADVVACPNPNEGATVEQTLRVADLTLEAAQRQTELGRHVLLAVDSLTGLWGAMLEAEAADAQERADQSRARSGIRDWMQRAGNFGGAGLLGSGLGGSLTIVGAVWQQAVDSEAEEEREVHPHLRLLEHILHETSWRVPLSPTLARERLYPALDIGRCFSANETNLLSPSELNDLLTLRRALADLSPLARYDALQKALEAQSPK